jgi:molybdopterin biosynthesis enzyme
MRPVQGLVSTTQAIAALARAIKPVSSRQVRLREAEGLVLAAPIIAPTAIPPALVALRGGYAVRAGDTVGASSYNPVFLGNLPPKVGVGDTLPEGSDAILPFDALSVEAGVVQVCQCIAPGESVRWPGGDASQAEILRKAGDRVRSIDVACGLTAGIDSCSVRRLKPRLLTAPESNEAVGMLVATLLRRTGTFLSVPRPFVSRADLGVALCEPGTDLIIVIGGSGFWRSENLPDSVAGVGTLITHGLAVRPGEAGGCGIVNKIPVLLIPSQIEAALALMLTVVQPCLSILLDTGPARATRRGILSRKLVSDVGLSEVALLRDVNGEFEPLAVADLSLSAVAAADAWLMLPPSSEGIAAGTVIEAHSLWWSCHE